MLYQLSYRPAREEPLASVRLYQIISFSFRVVVSLSLM